MTDLVQRTLHRLGVRRAGRLSTPRLVSPRVIDLVSSPFLPIEANVQAGRTEHENNLL